MKLAFSFLLLCLILIAQLQEIHGQKCQFKFKGTKLPGFCLKKKDCRRLRSGPSGKCGSKSICCDATVPQCQRGGRCTIRAFCNKKEIIGKCGDAPFSQIVCCKNSPKTLPSCGKGGTCNLREECEKKDIIGPCATAPMSVVVCCKKSLRNV